MSNLLTVPQLRKLADKTYGHSRDCKRRIEDCDTCQATIAWFRSLRLETLSKTLEEPIAPRMPMSVADHNPLLEHRR